ncbi:hypothetical protein FRACYDRAFT_270713, partial [Fragilariopsis cylindrus CCMP1102]
MSSYHAQKSMISLIRLKQRLQSKNKTHRITPINSDDDEEDHDDGGATILVNRDIDNKKSIGDTNIVGGNRDTKKLSSSVFDDDLYTPLSPEEADEDQLAEFLNSFEVLFLEEEEEQEQEQVQARAQVQTRTQAHTMIEESNHTILDVTHSTLKRSRPSKRDYSTYSASHFTDSDDAIDDDII